MEAHRSGWRPAPSPLACQPVSQWRFEVSPVDGCFHQEQQLSSPPQSPRLPPRPPALSQGLRQPTHGLKPLQVGGANSPYGTYIPLRNHGPSGLAGG